MKLTLWASKVVVMLVAKLKVDGLRLKSAPGSDITFLGIVEAKPANSIVDDILRPYLDSEWQILNFLVSANGSLVCHFNMCQMKFYKIYEENNKVLVDYLQKFKMVVSGFCL